MAARTLGGVVTLYCPLPLGGAAYDTLRPNRAKTCARRLLYPSIRQYSTPRNVTCVCVYQLFVRSFTQNAPPLFAHERAAISPSRPRRAALSNA